jgi:mono/diheme cytochrome c family protein
MTSRLVTLTLVVLAPLASLASLASGPAARASASQDNGKALYDANCMQCHGVRGVPPRDMKAALPKVATFNAAFIASRTDDSITKVLTRGKNDDMPSFKGKLTTTQMAIIAKYVRVLASK